MDRAAVASALRAVLLDPADALRMDVHGAKHAAVLAPLYLDAEGALHAIFTKRREDLRRHPGEISFPGGRRDEGEELLATALREAHEEIGLDPDAVEIIGELDHLTTISSRSFIVPFVGALPARPDLTPNPNEVDHVLFVPLSELLLEEVYREELWGIGPVNRSIYFFELVGDTVWGATAHMLHEFLDAVTGRTAPPAPGR